MVDVLCYSVILKHGRILSLEVWPNTLYKT